MTISRSRSQMLYWLPKYRTPRVSKYVQDGYTRLNCAAGWGEPNMHLEGFECASFEVYCRLLPISLEHWSPDRSSISFPIPSYQDGAFKPAPSDFLTEVKDLRMSPTLLADWLCEVLGEKPLTNQAEIQNAMCQPHTLLRLGYRSAKLSATQDGIKSLGFQAAMCSIGIAAQGIDFWTCNYCFRRTRGALRCCDVHSQSKLVLTASNAEKNSQLHQSRTAQKVAKIFANSKRACRDPYGYFEMELCEYELQVGGILWPLEGDVHRDWLKHVMDALMNAPIVKSRLPVTFEADSPHFQLSALQEAVGSREWVMSRWPEVILIAEAWLNIQVEISPTSKAAGLSQLNRSRLIIVKNFLAAGYRHSQIAAELGISRSHLSHLLRRGGISAST